MGEGTKIRRALLPVLIRETARDLQENGFRCRCPAARTDNGHTVLLCGIERQWFPVARQPLAVKMWCAGEYTECPTWRAARDKDPAVEEHHQAQDDAVNAKLTKRQVEAGIRVDDRGLEHGDLPDDEWAELMEGDPLAGEETS